MTTDPFFIHPTGENAVRNHYGALFNTGFGETQGEKRKREFTIDRGGGRKERTVVGVTGQKHLLEFKGPGKDGHFQYWQESEYRRAIERAVEDNSH